MPPRRAPPKVSYALSMPKPHTHDFAVEMRIAWGGGQGPEHADLVMPVWTPGSYLVRDFARHVRDFDARGPDGRALNWEKVDKTTWCVEVGGRAEIVVRYTVYANELTVDTSHLDADHGYVNGAAVFLYVDGLKAIPHDLRIRPPPGWHVTTGLSPRGANRYTAPDYDVLVDCPIEIGTHRVHRFRVRGVEHRVAIWGHGNVDARRFVGDLARIVRATAAIFGDLPYEHYTFIVHLTEKGGGGLEHENSTTLNVRRWSFEPRKTYEKVLSLAAHEFFHTWNVKRIRPTPLGPFDYKKEVHTRLLWAMEGFTDYYDQQVLRRAGLITPRTWRENLAERVKLLEEIPGRLVQSLDAASFDTWIKFYKPDESSVNTAISYYLKGEVVGCLLDLEIRRRTRGRRSLDDVLKLLYRRYGKKGVGFPEAAYAATVAEVAGAPLTDFFKRYVAGTEELPYDRFFRAAGLRMVRRYDEKPPKDLLVGEVPVDGKPVAPKRARGYMGVRLKRTDGHVLIDAVLSGHGAHRDGVNAGDELLAVDGFRVDDKTLADRIEETRPGTRVTVSVFRRDELYHVPVVLGKKPFDKYEIVQARRPSRAAKRLYERWLRCRWKDG
ncbi:MAG: M61 family metallopeptidase [Methanobacteriota archaeon]